MNREHSQRPPHGEDLRRVIFSIFGGDKPGHTPLQRRACCKEAYREPVGMQVNLTEASRAHLRNSPILITFTEDEGKRLHHPKFDALVIDVEIERHKVMRNLINNGSLADINFARALDQLDLPNKTL